MNFERQVAKEIVGKALNQALEFAKSGDANSSEKILRSLPQEDLRVRYNLGWHDIRHGRLLKGIEGLIAGRFLGVFGSPSIPGRLWKDENLNGKTLLFRMEGGLGDEVINFRFAKEFRSLGANVVICGDKSLLPVWAEHGFAGVTENAIPFVHYDFWVPAMSAAYVLGKEHRDIDKTEYLNKVAPLGKSDKLRIGLRWGGNNENEDVEPMRKVGTRMLGLAGCIDAEFVSLQRDADLPEKMDGVQDLRFEMQDWNKTRAWICGLDLLITSCTSVAHVAAAMGIRTWILVPVMPYYTWAHEADGNHWYNSVKLFRQKKAGDWEGTLQEVKMELQNSIGEFQCQK